MSVALWVLLITALIPSLLSFLGGYFRKQEFGTLDNNNPRKQYAASTGPAGRTFAAQQNAYEALILLTAAMVAASITGVAQERLTVVALVFLLARILHAIFYVADKGALRSLSYIVALGSVICIFVLGA